MTFDSLYQKWLATFPSTTDDKFTTTDAFMDTVFAYESLYLDTTSPDDGDLWMNLYSYDEFYFLLQECETLSSSS